MIMTQGGKQRFSVALVLFAVCCLLSARVSGQMKSDPSGTWGGAMTTEVATTGIALTLSRDASGWKARLKARQSQGQEATWPVRDLQITDASISFAVSRPGNLMKFAGKFAGDKLAGEVEIFHNNRKVGCGTFSLTFGADAGKRSGWKENESFHC
jgi:hypothetical protein